MKPSLLNHANFYSEDSSVLKRRELSALSALDNQEAFKLFRTCVERARDQWVTSLIAEDDEQRRGAIRAVNEILEKVAGAQVALVDL